MEEILAFINGFISAEYDALRATYLEPDDVLASRVEVATRYLHVAPGHVMTLGFGRKPAMTAEELARDADWVEDFRPRVLFLIKHYRSETWGDLYACVTSSYQKLQLLAYGSCFFVARLGAGNKIISHYYPGDTLPSGATQWLHLAGSIIDNRGELVATHKLLAPELPSHLADYRLA